MRSVFAIALFTVGLVVFLGRAHRDVSALAAEGDRPPVLKAVEPPKPAPIHHSDVPVVGALRDYAANSTLADAKYIGQRHIFHGKVQVKYSNSSGAGVIMGDPTFAVKGAMLFDATPEVVATLSEGEAVSVDCEILGHKIAGAAVVVAGRCDSWEPDTRGARQ
jgi:hypothetical protein